MEAQLHAVDDEREFHARPSKGKKSWVYSEDFEIQPSTGQVMITARTSEQIGSGDRGGIPKDIRRTLTLWLSSRDIKRIVNAAFSAGLLTAAVEIAKPKKAKKRKKTK